MKNILLILIITVIALTLNTYSEEKIYGHESVEKLVKSIKIAASKKDKDLSLQCSCWKRLSTNLQERFKNTTPLFMKDRLLDIKVNPSTKDPFEGTEFEYNVSFRGNLVFTYKKYGSITVGYGEHKERFYLATPVRRQKK